MEKVIGGTAAVVIGVVKNLIWILLLGGIGFMLYSWVKLFLVPLGIMH